MSSFLDLPDELILKVLSYTEIADLLSCGQVSKRIRTISNDDSLFQTEIISGNYVTTFFGTLDIRLMPKQLLILKDGIPYKMKCGKK